MRFRSVRGFPTAGFPTAGFCLACLLAGASLLGPGPLGGAPATVLAEPPAAQPDPSQPDPGQPDPGQPDPAQPDPGQPDFTQDVLPILRTHCVSCHGPRKQESNIRLDNLSTDLVDDRAAAETWHEVRNVLNAGQMPPEDQPQLTAEQRAIVTAWLTTKIDQAIAARRDTDGRVVLRRLNRFEYQQTMTDLLGLDMDYARDLPPDAVSADGFLNDGRSLRMSALQLEYYLQSARRALDRVIVSGPAPRVFHHEFAESNVGGWLGDSQRSNRLGRYQEFLAKMVDDYPEQGDFLVRVRLSAELKPDVGYPLLEVSVGYRPDTKILFREFPLVEISQAEEQTLEFRGRIEEFPLPVRGQGKFPGLVVRLRNVYDDGSPRAKGQKEKKAGVVYPEEPHLPTLQVQSVEFHGPHFDHWPPATHRRILHESPLRESDEKAYLTEVLQRFLPRAYRRPVEDPEVEAMVEFYESIRGEFETFEDAARETLALALIRPDFLYLMEPADETRRPLTDWELASRLSYFLWSTMPDELLNQRAAAAQLRQPEVLASEVQRMLADPRSRRFVDRFTQQWLHLEGIDRVAVSRDYYPEFDDRLKLAMQGETQAFFAELLAQDLSALNLLSADFTMLNEPLARHYGIGGVYGREFRRVALEPERKRGGLLGQAGILLANSTGEDSHAVRRAVWIRDRLLNDPPAPPPPDVPTLDEADPKFHKLSVREQLVVHRQREACASCHRGIDPLGIALENFDAVGLWRDQVRRKVGPKFETLPVDASDVLPNGRKLDGIDSLKTYLLTERRADFARSLVTRLLAYALGRRLELSDQPTVDQLVQRLVASDYRLADLIQGVVASEPFRTK